MDIRHHINIFLLRSKCVFDKIQHGYKYIVYA